ncbi:hypothetical protein U1Q18_047309 [Sarracenia purpurea var. burkii]
MTTSAPSRVSTSAFFYTVDDLRPSTIHLLRGFETAPGSDDEETEADVEATKQGNVVAQPLESVQEKRRCPNRGDSDTPRVEVEDDELEDEEDDDGKTLVSDTDGTESEIS